MCCCWGYHNHCILTELTTEASIHLNLGLAHETVAIFEATSLAVTRTRPHNRSIFIKCNLTETVAWLCSHNPKTCHHQGILHWLYVWLLLACSSHLTAYGVATPSPMFSYPLLFDKRDNLNLVILPKNHLQQHHQSKGKIESPQQLLLLIFCYFTAKKGWYTTSYGFFWLVYHSYTKIFV